MDFVVKGVSIVMNVVFCSDFQGMSILSEEGLLVSIPTDGQERFLASRNDLAKSVIANVNNIVKQGFDLLVGADGANSQIRNAMEKEIEGFKISTTTNSGLYKTFAGLPVVEDAGTPVNRSISYALFL